MKTNITNIIVAILVLISVAVWAFDEMGDEAEQEASTGFSQAEIDQNVMPQDYVASTTVAQSSGIEPSMPEANAEQAGASDNTAATQSNVSEKCIKSMSHLYRFYFHEIYPNPKNAACQKLSDTMSPKETAEMQVVINELKTNCPASFVKQIHASFSELKKERDA